MSAEQPVIIIKKRGHGKHAHHGGAWKVAYADFVTAMMAFFLVMWIVGQSKAVRDNVAAYFRDPGAFEHDGGRGVLSGSERGTTGGGQPDAGTDVERAKLALEKAAEHLRATLAAKFGNLNDRIEIRLTEEGLLIELREAPDDGFFATGSAVAKPETVAVLTTIAGELGQLPNRVAVEGHTDSRPYASREGYTNWELSADRANSARRILEKEGLKPHQVEIVRGYADQRLRYADKPLDAGNRRISIVVRREETLHTNTPSDVKGAAPPPIKGETKS